MRTRFLVLTVLVLSYLAVEGRTALAEPPAQPAKTVKFIVEGKPWRDVFEWLTQVTGKPVVTDFKPSGKFPCLDLPNKEYTILEVYDIINTALQGEGQTQRYYLLSCKRTFHLVPADERIDPVLLPRVKRDDLVKHGNTELVSVVLPLTKLDAGKMAPIVNVMLGPNGSVYPITTGGSNLLILIDRVGKLKRVGPFLLVLDTVIDPVSHFPRLQR